MSNYGVVVPAVGATQNALFFSRDRNEGGLRAQECVFSSVVIWVCLVKWFSVPDGGADLLYRNFGGLGMAGYFSFFFFWFMLRFTSIQFLMSSNRSNRSINWMSFKSRAYLIWCHHIFFRHILGSSYGFYEQIFLLLLK